MKKIGNFHHRGFDKFIGKTIRKIDASSINVVHFEFTDGVIFSIDAEETHYGIPVVSSEIDWFPGVSNTLDRFEVIKGQNGADHYVIIDSSDGTTHAEAYDKDVAQKLCKIMNDD